MSRAGRARHVGPRRSSSTYLAVFSCAGGALLLFLYLFSPASQRARSSAGPAMPPTTTRGTVDGPGPGAASQLPSPATAAATNTFDSRSSWQRAEPAAATKPVGSEEGDESSRIGRLYRAGQGLTPLRRQQDAEAEEARASDLSARQGAAARASAGAGAATASASSSSSSLNADAVPEPDVEGERLTGATLHLFKQHGLSSSLPLSAHPSSPVVGVAARPDAFAAAAGAAAGAAADAEAAEADLAAATEPALLSRGKPATASARGNLGPAGVVTSGVVRDWLRDRWQAAKNMQGVPIPGTHWLEVQLSDGIIGADGSVRGAYGIRRVRIDFETAYCAGYDIQGSAGPGAEWFTLATVNRPTPSSDEPSLNQHVVHVIEIPPVPAARTGAAGHLPPRLVPPRASSVRMMCHKRGTGYGVSVWTLDVFGN